MEVIRGPVLPRCNAPALTSDARIGSQLLGRVRTRRRACGGVLQGDYYGVSPRLFGVPAQQHSRSGWLVCCSYGSSSDGDGTAAANFDTSGEEFVDSSVMEAVELRSVSDGFVIKLRDGRNLTCVQNNPRVLRLRDSAPHHAIVLKMEDGSGLLLPIIVMETPSIMLLAALRNIRIRSTPHVPGKEKEQDITEPDGGTGCTYYIVTFAGETEALANIKKHDVNTYITKGIIYLTKIIHNYRRVQIIFTVAVNYFLEDWLYIDTKGNN
uniref:Uncharacterized protein n=2 Tax=Avena sativa TaxID=4498 RepID=A0ACD5W759_AVESA